MAQSIQKWMDRKNGMEKKTTINWKIVFVLKLTVYTKFFILILFKISLMMIRGGKCVDSVLSREKSLAAGQILDQITVDFRNVSLESSTLHNTLAHY